MPDMWTLLKLKLDFFFFLNSMPSTFHRFIQNANHFSYFLCKLKPDFQNGSCGGQFEFSIRMI